MPESKGHLNPGAAGVVFDRFALGPGLDDLMRHVWVVRWNLPDGESKWQRVLSYPAFNVVFTPGDASLFGPDSRVSTQNLVGRSWAVGLLFRPAAGPLLTTTVATELVDRGERLTAAPSEAVESAMARGDRAGLVRSLRTWLLPVAQRVDETGRLVNEACRIAEEDTTLVRAVDLAGRMHLAPRTLERAVRRHIGVTPKWLIECRRLQEAGTRLFTQPQTELSTLAAELGYSDHAHFSRQYKRVLGETPDETRRAGRRAADAAQTEEAVDRSSRQAR